jgi:hypothetical protein
MANSLPKDPKVNDVGINGDGKLSSWNGKDWEVPQENDVRLDDAGELHYWDEKKGWVLYEDPPESPDGDSAPKWVYKLR